jgi:HAD superfamily hydrolase (TIGR01509 family)
MTIPKKHAVIFDCDGVMFDSRQANINYYNFLLAQFDLPPMDETEIHYVHMHTASESVRHVFQGTPHIKDADEFRMQMDYSPFVRDMVIEPGLKKLLRELKPDFGLAVATNRSNTIGEVLRVNGLDQYFDIVVSSLDVNHPKPHPESVFKILDFFGIGPEACVYVGDSKVDQDTCKAANVKLIAYKNRALEEYYNAVSMSDLSTMISSFLQKQPI